MNASINAKLEQLSMRLEEIGVMLSDPEVCANQNKFRELSIEHAQLTPINEQFEQYLSTQADIEAAKAMLLEDDDDIRAMAKEEIAEGKETLEQLDLELKKSLLPKDPNDARNIIIEVRAGTGGDEASIFSGDLFKMYTRYVEKQKWQIEIMSSNAGEHGGFKEIIARISGTDVYSKLKFESGAHRVQRVPETESQGRVHTSACTVAIMPEVKNIEEVDINMSDVRVDTFRASGAGGQHVNKTDSAVRVTHLPTGTVVECQDGRSQHKNKAQAMSVLASRILDAQQQRQQKEQASTRKELVGSGDRSQRIRTYNYPQGRITDHRINLTLYKLAEIMEGDLESIIEPLIVEQQTNQLSELNDAL
ncbi:Peptide chain release factor 1 [Bathymodiolus thermophilus thioautotrophic gill symbiont]|jgi:peptide chain release factor 1|uniref:Peptide chain release factor 1 n=1 Tax=Bathymodiolus thermophilus thioautotrophic gill symbiont TaxID=2360 RepID=A0A1J5TVV7_9GAMM|nr:peptide chain release factor 1 [Bathymodiolus thermophilus thioautotrophic gill symbiont]AYQ56352.1 Peptide chain release factor 1 [Bathymodiolus thermophilus thioautotrophic gill symbiont]OIR24316.1 peptide chain release factor 1 [Bathymodiolus thermophilus thioautotrophic gill symbiont]CAB5501770.1 Peptide chain release factor 1 [Bathymodiolus thermophilus thioautotrophic gill symbiont]SGZ67123.1 Peptide chain release factor 1 [Bathymodiolus thermophilus thioautotrophic gill symbiont]